MEQHSSKTSEEKTVIGPVLPPHLIKKSDEESLKNEENSGSPHLLNVTEERGDSIGPQLPPHLRNTKSESIGPALPLHLLKKSDESTWEEDNPSCFGPQIPQHLRQKFQEETPSSNLEESAEEDEDVYGPLPPAQATLSKSQIALEERALQLKMDQLDPQQSKATVREEWMLELPAVKAANLGLGPRQFRSKVGPDFSDRSSWTDIPNKKKAKKEIEVDLKKEAEMKEIRKRDEEQEKISKKHKKKNKESLLQLHQNEMKKKKKNEGDGQGERRPFSREIDLQVNRFDEAQKKAILKKAQLLDDRFSSGQSKFL